MGEADEIRWDRDVPPPPPGRHQSPRPGTPSETHSEEQEVRTPPVTTRRLKPSGSFQPHPFSSWVSRLWRTLTFRPGVYREMMEDRHATWQAAVTWLVGSGGLALATLVYTGSVLTGVLQLIATSLVGLILWTAVVHIGSRLTMRSSEHSYTQTIRVIGFSMVPAMGLLLVDGNVGTVFSVWGLAMQVHGIREGLGLTWPRAIAIALIPWLLWVGLFVFVIYLACSLGAC